MTTLDDAIAWANGISEINVSRNFIAIPRHDQRAEGRRMNLICEFASATGATSTLSRNMLTLINSQQVLDPSPSTRRLCFGNLRRGFINRVETALYSTVPKPNSP